MRRTANALVAVAVAASPPNVRLPRPTWRRPALDGLVRRDDFVTLDRAHVEGRTYFVACGAADYRCGPQPGATTW
jgi:hypothetical protein